MPMQPAESLEGRSVSLDAPTIATSVDHPWRRLTAFLQTSGRLVIAAVFTVIALALVVISSLLMIMVELEEKLLGRYRNARRQQQPKQSS